MKDIVACVIYFVIGGEWGMLVFPCLGELASFSHTPLSLTDQFRDKAE